MLFTLTFLTLSSSLSHVSNQQRQVCRDSEEEGGRFEWERRGEKGGGSGGCERFARHLPFLPSSSLLSLPFSQYVAASLSLQMTLVTKMERKRTKSVCTTPFENKQKTTSSPSPLSPPSLPLPHPLPLPHLLLLLILLLLFLKDKSRILKVSSPFLLLPSLPPSSQSEVYFKSGVVTASLPLPFSDYSHKRGYLTLPIPTSLASLFPASTLPPLPSPTHLPCHLPTLSPTPTPKRPQLSLSSHRHCPPLS